MGVLKKIHFKIYVSNYMPTGSEAAFI